MSGSIRNGTSPVIRFVLDRPSTTCTLSIVPRADRDRNRFQDALGLQDGDEAEIVLTDASGDQT